MTEKSSTSHPNAEAFPAGVSGPALRALAQARVRTMAQLAQWTEMDLAKLHGMGPKALRILKEGLAQQGRQFRAR